MRSEEGLGTVYKHIEGRKSANQDLHVQSALSIVYLLITILMPTCRLIPDYQRNLSIFPFGGVEARFSVGEKGGQGVSGECHETRPFKRLYSLLQVR